MIDSVEIVGFRCFKRLSISNLTRINLFVGLNNCGKTSALEALYTLVRLGDPTAFADFMSRRNEIAESEKRVFRLSERRLDVRRLFYGHELGPQTSFQIISQRGSLDDRQVVCTVVERPSSDTVTTTTTPDPNSVSAEKIIKRLSPKYLRVYGQHYLGLQRESEIALSRFGGLDVSRVVSDKLEEQLEPAHLVLIESSSLERVADGWRHIFMSPRENQVVEAVRLVEPDLLQIGYAPAKSGGYGEFRVRLRSSSELIPIKSMGDGMWRMLSLIVAIVQCENGFLFVDEIDTGLHHTIISDMWKVVLTTAERLNVQVFATTHSLDCVRGLAQICDESRSNGEDRVSMHRIERGKPEAIHYSEAEIVIAASEGIETR